MNQPEMTMDPELLLKQRRTVALLEYPLLKVRISDGMARRGIPYLLETVIDRNILTVQVVGEYFLQIPVTAEAVDRIVGLIPYCLNRPDLAHAEIPGIQRFKSFTLARKWARVATRPTLPPAAPPAAE
jgi:hypothetical protein